MSQPAPCDYSHTKRIIPCSCAKERVLPLCRRTLAEQLLSIEVSATSSCCDHSTWGTSSVSLHNKAVTFHIPRANLSCQKSVCFHSSRSWTLSLQSSWLVSWTSLAVELFASNQMGGRVCCEYWRLTVLVRIVRIPFLLQKHLISFLGLGSEHIADCPEDILLIHFTKQCQTELW